MKKKYNPIFTDKYQMTASILKKIFNFIYNDFILTFIRCNFYVTEKHKEGGKLFYFTKPVWHLIQKISILEMQQQNLEKTDEYKVENPISKLRFVPKTDNVRPIMTFYKQFYDDSLKRNVKIKYYLKDSGALMRMLQQQLGDPNKDGLSVFDNKTIFGRLEKFITQWK